MFRLSVDQLPRLVVDAGCSFDLRAQVLGAICGIAFEFVRKFVQSDRFPD
jgi:hypothetical protein